MNEKSKGYPIPTRFEPEEEEMIDALRKKTGLSRSEIVRRSVRFLRSRIEETGDSSFLYELPRMERKHVRYSTMTEAIVVTDPEGRITTINRAFTQMCGYTLKELRGKKPGAVLQGPATEKDVVRDFRRAIKAVKPFECTLTNYDKKQTPYRVFIQMKPIFEGRTLTGFEAREKRLRTGEN